jgi:hypothetical protein
MSDRDECDPIIVAGDDGEILDESDADENERKNRPLAAYAQENDQ